MTNGRKNPKERQAWNAYLTPSEYVEVDMARKELESKTGRRMSKKDCIVAMARFSQKDGKVSDNLIGVSKTTEDSFKRILKAYEIYQRKCEIAREEFDAVLHEECTRQEASLRRGGLDVDFNVSVIMHGLKSSEDGLSYDDSESGE